MLFSMYFLMMTSNEASDMLSSRSFFYGAIINYPKQNYNF